MTTRCLVGAALLLVACTPKSDPPPPGGQPSTPTAAKAEVQAEALAPEETPAAPAVDAPAVPSCEDPCMPRKLADAPHPSHVLVDEERVYWISGEALHAVSREGGEAKVLAADLRGARVQTRDEIFACRRGPHLNEEVFRVAKADGASTSLGFAVQCEMAIVGDFLYFAERVDWGNEWIVRVPLAGGDRERVSRLPQTIEELITDGESLFWASGSEVFRFEPEGKVLTRLLEDTRATALGLTADHLYWIDTGNIARIPKAGGSAETVANYQDALRFASDGEHLYWASNSDRGWTRLDSGATTLRKHDVPEGAAWIAVDGTRVFWASWGERGAIMTMETCRCDDVLLPPRPAIRPMEGPAPDDVLTYRWGYADGADISVQVRDLSSDEGMAVESLAQKFTDTIPAGTPGVPPRFAIGDRFRVATTEGVFDAHLTGHSVGLGGEGTHFFLELEAPGMTGAGALVAPASTGKLAKLREPVPDADADIRYIADIRRVAKAAGIGVTISRKHTRVIPAVLPAPHAVIIEVAVDAGYDEGVPEYAASGLLLGDAKGKITGAISELGSGLDSYAVEYLVDLGEDGIDEVVYRSSYYEGDYSHLVTWTSGAPRSQLLAGDGA